MDRLALRRLSLISWLLLLRGAEIALQAKVGNYDRLVEPRALSCRVLRKFEILRLGHEVVQLLLVRDILIHCARPDRVVLALFERLCHVEQFVYAGDLLLALVVG